MINITERLSNKFRNLSVLCAFFVVIIHSRPQFDQGGFGWYMKQLLENGVCEMAVPFFFLTSGFFIATKIRGGGYKCEVIKRVRTLLVPYGFWILMFLLFIMSVRREFWVPALWEIGLDPFRCPVLSPLWYVRALVCLVLMSPAILWGLRKSSVMTLLALLFLYGVICPYSPMPRWDRLKDFARVGPIPVLGLFYFTVGMALRLGKLNDVIERVGKVASIIWLVLGLVLVVARAIVIDIGLELLGAYCGFASIPFLILGFWGMVPKQKGPSWLVLSSFPVYVIHKFFYPIVGRCIDENIPCGYVLCFVSVFVLSIVAANIIRNALPKISAIAFGGR